MAIIKAHTFRQRLLLIAITSTTAFAQGTAFTYPATVGAGTQQGPTLTPPPVTVAVGIFTVQLDLGACASCFDGSARFLEIAVKPTSGSTFTTLNPRQQLTTSPYAIRSLSAANATTADGLSVSGVANYIQNTSSPQANSNFNISGNGTAGGTPEWRHREREYRQRHDAIQPGRRTHRGALRIRQPVCRGERRRVQSH